MNKESELSLENYDIQKEVDEIVWEKDIEHLQKLYRKANGCGCRQCWREFEEWWEVLAGMPWQPEEDREIMDLFVDDEDTFAWG